MYKTKLLVFCVNLDKYLGGGKERSDASLEEVATSDGSGKPMTLGERYKHAKHKNGLPLAWVKNDLLIIELITARNRYVHTGEFTEQTKLYIQLAMKELPSLFISNVIVNEKNIEELLAIDRKASVYLKKRFNCVNEDVGKICVELYRRKEFKKISQKVWDFARLRNKILHQTLYLGQKDLEQLSSFRKFINNEIERSRK